MRERTIREATEATLGMTRWASTAVYSANSLVHAAENTPNKKRARRVVSPVSRFVFEDPPCRHRKRNLEMA